MDESEVLSNNDTIKSLMKILIDNYFSTIHNKIKEDPSLINTIPGLIINPESIVIYVGKTHIAIEFFGSEVLESYVAECQGYALTFLDLSLNDGNLLENIISFNVNTDNEFFIPIFDDVFDLVWATDNGYEKLRDLRWNYSAQDMMLIMSSSMPVVMEERACSLINAFFFDADKKGLKTRHIKWMNFIPIIYDDSNKGYDTFKIDGNIFKSMALENAYTIYPLPEEYKNIHLPKINRFIELWGNEETSEPQINKFLEENSFILKMAFGATDIYAEKECIWQTQDKKPIRPDFFIKRPHRVDIVEFKLPTMKSSSIVGRENRESFCAQLSSYISQTRTYANYFDDSQNRSWVKETHGIDIYKPRRILIIGRRINFDREEWREIVADYNDFEIMTFDDLVDGVIAQFYHE